MPDCAPFRLYVGEQVLPVVSVMREELKRKGFSVSGTDQSGAFSIPLPGGGALSGSFSVSGKSLAVTISDRPEAVTCGTIESKMQDFILDANAVLKNRPKP